MTTPNTDIKLSNKGKPIKWSMSVPEWGLSFTLDHRQLVILKARDRPVGIGIVGTSFPNHTSLFFINRYA